MTNPLIDLLNQIRTHIPENQEGVDMTEIDQIFEQIQTGIEGQSSLITERDSSIEMLSTTVSDLKAKNYDLLTRIPASDEGNLNEGGGSGEALPITIEDLFKKPGGE